MANFDVSNLLNAQQILDKKYASVEQRMKPAPAFELLTSNQTFIQGLEQLKTRDDRPTTLYYIKRTKRGAGSSRTHNHTGTIDDTAAVTPTWTTKSDVFAISLKLLNKNVFDFNTVLANKFEQAAMNILEDKETEAIAYLRAQRATQQPTLKGGSFSTPNTAVEINADKATTFFQRLKSIMRQNYFSGMADVIVDSNMNLAAEFLMAQGSANAQNTMFQFPGLRIVESVELDDTNYPQGIALGFPQGQVCAMNWIPKENRQGVGDYNSYVGGFGTFNFMGYTFAVHGYAQRADTSSANGDTQDMGMEFEVSLDTSFNKAPISYTTNRTDSVIIEFAQTT